MLVWLLLVKNQILNAKTRENEEAGGEVHQEGEKEGSKRGQMSWARKEPGGEVQHWVAERSYMWIGEVKKGGQKRADIPRGGS